MIHVCSDCVVVSEIWALSRFKRTGWSTMGMTCAAFSDALLDRDLCPPLLPRLKGGLLGSRSCNVTSVAVAVHCVESVAATRSAFWNGCPWPLGSYFVSQDLNQFIPIN